jgi:hypothetical protein
VIAIIGIILLIGIVKKNAIMMIDFALEAERNQGMSPAGRDLPGRLAALPPDPDDDAGGAVRRGAADAGPRAQGPNCVSRWAWCWSAVCCSASC